MKTQCPHCQAKLKAPDGATGKKVNCPKCNQPFVISPLIIKDNIVEACSNCSKEIGELEQACVFNGKIVCAECDKKLRSDLVIEKVQKTEVTYKGVRGWLLFFCLSLTVLSPLGNSILWVMTFNNVSPHFSKFPGLRTCTVIDGLLTLVLIGFSIYAGIALWRIRPNAVNIAKTYLRVYLMVVVIEIFLPLIMAGLPTELYGDIIKEGFKGAARAYVFFSIWNSYLSKSKRVKATYGEFFG